MAAADGLRSVATLDPAASQAPRLKVFVSYSRTDTAFADEIVAGLEYDGGFEVFIDRHSIHEGEAWRDRLSGLIAAADIIVFLLTKSSAKSELCKWEAEYAQGLSKRLVPVLVETVDGEAAPSTLRALHYVRFDEGRSFMQGLAALRRALRADFAWVQEHTRLLMRAQEWDAASRAENRLLSGPDITAAKAWLEQHPVDAPPPLELHRDYISASDRAEIVRLSKDRKQAEELKNALARSKRALTISIALGVVAVVAGLAAGASYFQTRAIGAQAELAVADRDRFIKETAARDLEQERRVTGLMADRDQLRHELEKLYANASASGELAIMQRESRIAEMAAMLNDLGSARGEKSGLPARPVRTAEETTAAYADRLDGHLNELERQYLNLLKSPATKPRTPAPYDPRL